MPHEMKFQHYMSAFNRGDQAGYTAYYAPQIVLTNGAGMRLEGAQSIADFYAGLNGKIHRQIEIISTICATNCLAAALRSEFEILVDECEFSGETLSRGTKVQLESMALYEIVGGLFSSIKATSLRRSILAPGAIS